MRRPERSDQHIGTSPFQVARLDPRIDPDRLESSDTLQGPTWLGIQSERKTMAHRADHYHGEIIDPHAAQPLQLSLSGCLCLERRQIDPIRHLLTPDVHCNFGLYSRGEEPIHELTGITLIQGTRAPAATLDPV